MTQEGFKRKLTAILSADAVGYSRLMGDDEAATVRTLTSFRNVISTLIKQHNGTVIDSPGDNLLAEFVSVVDAVQCAVLVQEELKARNDQLPENRRMLYRIGINLGDVIEEEDRIYGDGVNIAARLEGLAERGGICISGTAYDQIKNKLPFRYECDGEQMVKNIKEPVRVYRVLIVSENAGKLPNKKKRTPAKKWLWTAASSILILLILFFGLYWKYFYLPASTKIDPDNKISFNLPKGPSIVVLPFVNMSSDPEQDYFCDGITENITSTLAHVSGLFVIARNSAFSFKGKSLKVQQIGHELGVDYVIEGSIQKSKDTIRITVQLVKTSTGNHLWSEIYDRKLIDIFKLQDEITIEILKTIEISITDGEGFRGLHDDVHDLKTNIKLLKMRHNFRQMNKESNNLTRKIALEIIETDKHLPLVYFALGYTYIWDIFYGVCKSPVICLGQATEAARKALSLDPNYHLTHLLVGNIFLIRKEHEKAIDELKRAIVINPNNDFAYLVLGMAYSCSGRPDEGINFIKKAIKLNPFPPSEHYDQLGLAYAVNNEFEKAIEAYKKSAEIEPNNIFSHIGLAGSYAALSNEEKARIEAKEVLNINPEFSTEDFTKVLPFKNPSHPKRLAEYLQKAGLM